MQALDIQETVFATEKLEEEEKAKTQEKEETKKKKQKCQYTFDISEASSAKALMEDIIKSSDGKWRLGSREKSDVRYVWCNAEDQDLINILKTKNRLINRYPGIKGLSHKDTFTRYMKVCLES